MTEEALQQCPLEGPSQGGHLSGDELGNTRVALEDFVGGEALEENLHLKCLDPVENEVWALRVVEKPQVRLFGWFFQRDGFIVSHLRARDDLGRGDQGERNFAAAIRKVMRKRDKSFAHIPRLGGLRFHDYVSNGVPDDFADTD